MRSIAFLLAALILGGCGGSATGSPVALPDAGSGMIWGSGEYGVVLVHQPDRDAASWASLAGPLSEAGMTVLAPEKTGPAAILAAIAYLREARGLARVAVLAADGSSAAAMAVGQDHPERVDQLILISAGGDPSRLGVFPKLFTASQGEPAAADAQRMADAAPGNWNALYLAPGSASGQAIFDSEGSAALQSAILRRLEERR